MDDHHLAMIAGELHLDAWQVEAAHSLLAQDATVPFIARYRKEVTGSLNEVQITLIRDHLHRLTELDARRAAILKSLEQNGHLTDKLNQDVGACTTLTALEDLYLPYRPKRRSRATQAREKGLEPLALLILEQTGADPQTAALEYLDPDKGVATLKEALAGARDIIAEMINEDGNARERMRGLFSLKGTIKSRVATGKEDQGAKYRDYFNWEEPAATAPSHRVLAVRRGESEDILNLSMLPPRDDALALIAGMFVTGGLADADQVRLAAIDGYKRLLSRAMETELRLAVKERAEAEAIRVFAGNLRELLLAPPLGAKMVMGVDPGFRTGCKIVFLDRQGKLLFHDTLFLHRSAAEDDRASRKILDLCRRHRVEAIAVGNGTAGRETLDLIRKIEFGRPVQVVMVNESGASIYSASEAARGEFPDLDLTVRGAVSIGRRLMDPLSELVKIDPKSIGVGQYQHDVDQSALKQALDDVVTSCVNGVGVDVNRASVQLLTYVSGLGPALAKNIVAYRNDKGPFESRQQLKNVARLGPKAFEQATGFLRIPDGEHPLDASAVHPESYPLVDAMARDLGCTLKELMTDKGLRKKIQPSEYVTDTVGLPTLNDILAELDRPGRDPRESFEAFEYADDVQKIQDLKPGMRLPGTVTNVTNFGAFVDVGVHQDGLVHISQLADRFVKDPTTVVKVNQKVRVTVIEIDLERNRISLSMKAQPGDTKKANGRPGTVKPRKKKLKQKDKPFNNPFAEAFQGKQK